MYSITVTLKNTPAPLIVFRKEQEDAQTTYNQVLEVIKNPAIQKVLELTCDKELLKKIAVSTDQISAVIMDSKSGVSAGARGAGFLGANIEAVS